MAGLIAGLAMTAAADDAAFVEVAGTVADSEGQSEALQVMLVPAEEGGETISPAEPAASSSGTETVLTGSSLSLPDALCLALERHPALAALQREVYAAQGRQIQGNLRPNPEVEASISELLGTAEMRWLRSAVTGVGVSQLIERGRKNCARMAVASEEQAVAQIEIERTRLDIMLEVSRAYANALVAQDRLRLALEQEALARQVYDVVALLVEGGKAARLELSRVEISLATAALEREQVERQHQTALKVLASLWGESEADFTHVEGQLQLPEEVPGVEQLRDLLQDSPDLARWQAQVALRQAELNLARADGVPDLTVSGGLERFEESDSFGFNVGISFPIPIHNRNQGAVIEAQEYMLQVEELRLAEQRALESELVSVYGELSLAYSQAATLQESVLPPAEETFELIQLGYRHGKFALLDVLDAERTVIEARSQYVEALAQYQLAAVELERLIASPLPNSAVAADAALSGACELIESPALIELIEEHEDSAVGAAQ
jgi:cobalt-zinc-cadmium efflux system outer membrane protein